MNTRVIPAIGLNLARRCKTVLLAQLYYAERELLYCCGVLTAFFVFFVAEGWFDSFTLEHFADTCLRLRSFETTSLFSNLNFFRAKLNFSLKIAEFLLNLTNVSRDFPKMQQFWENPKIAHLIFVLEMRTFNFRFEKHLIFIFTNI